MLDPYEVRVKATRLASLGQTSLDASVWLGLCRHSFYWGWEYSKRFYSLLFVPPRASVIHFFRLPVTLSLSHYLLLGFAVTYFGI